VLVGGLASGAVHVLLAAMRPILPRAVVWLEPMARYSEAPDYPWGVTAEEREIERDFLGAWGTDEYARIHVAEEEEFNPLPPETMAHVAVQSRNACTPDVAARLTEVWSEIDVRGVLGAVKAPTLLLIHEERSLSMQEAEYIASRMPAAEIRRMPGFAWDIKGMPSWADQIREFVGSAQPILESDTVLSTVLFTDIIGSTERQAALGDQAWKDLISKHHATIRALLDSHHGVEIDTAGDGFFATFDGPARAVRCAVEATQRVRELGLEIRAGVHTGECEVIDKKVGGISVSIGKRVAEHAGPSDVLVSQTVKDLVAGSGLSFEDAGQHELKGVPDRWRLYRAVGRTS